MEGADALATGDVPKFYGFVVRTAHELIQIFADVDGGNLFRVAEEGSELFSLLQVPQRKTEAVYRFCYYLRPDDIAAVYPAARDFPTAFLNGLANGKYV